MSGDGVITLDGQRVSLVRLCVPNVGPWFADCDLEEAPAVSGKVTLKIGEASFVGTVDPRSDGTYGLQRKTRIVGGGGGWWKAVKAKDYHNDANVKARTIADDLAREAGETIGTFIVGTERVGADYIRSAFGSAGMLLESVISGSPWWVDYAGVTHVGPRPSTTPDAGKYEVLGFDARANVLQLALDVEAVQDVGIGSVISERLDDPHTIRELEILVSADGIKVTAWAGQVDNSRSKLAQLIENIVRRIMGDKLFGLYRYRVTRVGVDKRLDLQVVRKRLGLPDAVSIPVWPGIAGGEMDPEIGTECLLAFLEGDRTLPAVVGFRSANAGALEIAYKGCSVKVLLPPAIFSGVVGVVPASGVLTFPMSSTLGTIETGSSRAKVQP